MIGLFRLLIIFGIIYFLSKLIGQLLFPFSQLNNKRTVSEVYHEEKRKAHKNEGRVTINNAKASKSSKKVLDGDFVDYEEVK
jgi:hypothetical protein